MLVRSFVRLQWLFILSVSISSGLLIYYFQNNRNKNYSSHNLSGGPLLSLRFFLWRFLSVISFYLSTLLLLLLFVYYIDAVMYTLRVTDGGWQTQKKVTIWPKLTLTKAYGYQQQNAFSLKSVANRHTWHISTDAILKWIRKLKKRSCPKLVLNQLMSHQNQLPITKLMHT